MVRFYRLVLLHVHFDAVLILSVCIGEARPKSVLGQDASKDGWSGSAGTQTPPTGPKRHPWTLYVKSLPIPVGEDELKTFFGEAAGGVSFLLLFLWGVSGRN